MTGALAVAAIKLACFIALDLTLVMARKEIGELYGKRTYRTPVGP